jgi:hypothetical protein
VKRKAPTYHDRKGTKALNKILEAKAAAKTLKQETNFHFKLGHLNSKGSQENKDVEAQKVSKKNKKRQAAERQGGGNSAVEQPSKRYKNDLE